MSNAKPPVDPEQEAAKQAAREAKEAQDAAREVAREAARRAQEAKTAAAKARAEAKEKRDADKAIDRAKRAEERAARAAEKVEEAKNKHSRHEAKEQRRLAALAAAAARIAAASSAGGWIARLALKASGKPDATVGNGVAILDAHPDWQGVFRLDVRAGTICVMRPSPLYDAPGTTFPRALRDVDATYLRVWLERLDFGGLDWGFKLPADVCFAAIASIAHQNQFDPVRDYFDSLVWDGNPRIATWLETYLGAEVGGPDDDTQTALYLHSVGPAWLISAVARTYEPGCQADSMLVLEGPQGIGKSTGIRALAGNCGFRDDVGDIRNKDAALAVHGPLIVEFAELDGLNRAEATAIKAFLSRAVDSVRPPYGRTTEDRDRRCVFFGTTNDHDYLRDATGNRRFWPVACGTVDRAAIARDRDQLWAEAVQAYHDGLPWHIEEAVVVAAAREQQASRLEQDVWTEKVTDYLAQHPMTTVPAILTHLGIPTEHQNRSVETRVGRILKTLGAVRHKVMLDGIRKYRYAMPSE